MRHSFTPQLYIRLRKRIRIPKGNSICLGEVAQLISPPEIESELKSLLLFEPREQDGNLVLIDMMLIVSKVKAVFPDLTIEHYGEPHALVEIDKYNKPPRLLLIAFVWFLLFIGSGLAIMNFHADVSMMKVHKRIFELITGRPMKHGFVLEIPYSVGIGLGMVIFFNHLFKKKFNEEPSPLEVEMFMYQENLNHYVITEEYCKLHERKRDSL